MAQGAFAQTPTMVLSVRPVDGEAEVARNLTAALRHSATRHAGWSVSERDVSLVQMTLAHDCDEPNAPCMVQVARTLATQLVIYGSVRRAPDGRAFAVELHIFNAATGAIEHSVQDSIPRMRSDVDDLRERVDRYVTELAGGTPPGVIRVIANVPGAGVWIDGAQVGVTDEVGSFTAEVEGGTHTVEVRVSGHTSHRESIRVGPGNEETVAASLTSLSPAGRSPVALEPASGGGSIVPGAVLLGAGAAFFGAALYAYWGEIRPIQNDADFKAYRSQFPAGESNVCDRAAEGIAQAGTNLERIQGLCDDASTWAALQYIFIGAGAVATGIGAYLLVDGLSSDSAHETPAVALRPSVGPQGGSLTASVRF